MEEMQSNPSIEVEAKENTITKKEITPFLRNLLIAIIALLTVVVFLVIWFLVRPNNETHKHELFNIEMISELTTLECRYHNVAVYEKEGGFLTVGKQYVWFEYDVLVDVGVDINEVIIEEPTEKGVVRIYLPKPKVLGAKEDKSTIRKPVKELGFLTALTADEEESILSEGVEKLKKDVEATVISQAYNSAKEILAQYVANVGDLVGEEYTVEWIEKFDNAETTGETGSTEE